MPPMPRRQRLISESIHVIREARARYGRLAVLWSMGKDSTLLVWLCRKAFLGEVPFPVVHIDTGYKLPEVYAFRERLARGWGLDLRVVRNEAALARGMGPETEDVLACCQALKTEALRQAVEGLALEAVLLGIRRDEHGVRAKERYFPPARATCSGPWAGSRRSFGSCMRRSPTSGILARAVSFAGCVGRWARGRRGRPSRPGPPAPVRGAYPGGPGPALTRGPTELTGARPGVH